MQVQHKANNKIFEAQILENDQVQVGSKIIKLSSFRRYYKKLPEQPKVTEQQVTKQQTIKQSTKTKSNFNWQKYYKAYKRNEVALFDVKQKDNKLLFTDQNDVIIVSCFLSKTKTCVVVEQLNNRAKRYFNEPQSAIKHICYDQGLLQVQKFQQVFDKWYKQQIKQ